MNDALSSEVYRAWKESSDRPSVGSGATEREKPLASLRGVRTGVSEGPSANGECISL